jgi:hypothetical protein
MTTSLLAFDIGINNLAYCHAIYDVKDKSLNIKSWNIIQLKQPKEKKDFTEISTILMQTLQRMFWDEHFDVVLLENQPVMKNPIMKTIQIMIYSFFMVQKTQKELDNQVKLVSAQSKLKVAQKDFIDCSHITTADKYKRNKETAISYARYYLTYTKQDEEWCLFFNQMKKLDDIADCLLYIINYLGI